MEQIQIQRISKEMTIGDFVKEYPSLTPILLNEGVHCVGCGASYWETIEQGLAGHGKTDKEIDIVIKKLNKNIPKESQSSGKLIITENAAKQVKAYLKKQKKEDSGLRIATEKGGCSGNQYVFKIDNKQKENDEVIEVKGVKFFVDKDSLQQLKGSKVDYVESLQESGFKISNPNATKTCGCGQSFR